MPKEWTDCVKSVIASGKPKERAYAICTAAFVKKHGMSPQEAEKNGMLDEVLKVLALEDLEALLEVANELNDDELAPDLTWLIEKVSPYHEARLQEKAGENVKDIYERNFTMPKAFFQTISSELKLEDTDEESKTVKIQVLRKGAFKHPQYGKISFDEKTFQSFIKNFEDKVPQEYVAYDFKHRPDWGAAAWVKSLFIEGDGLWAEAELTKRGLEALKNREFIYFSTEYVDDYKDRETGKSHGPTILGGGMTNRPFIKGMAPVLMSDDVEEEFIPVESSPAQKEIGGNMDELLKKIADLRAELTELVNQADSKEDIQKAFATVGEQIKSLEEKLDQTVKADDEKAKALEDAQKEVDEVKAALEAKNAELEAKNEETKNLTESLENAIKEKDARDAELKSHKEELRRKDVELFCNELGEKGLFPSTIEVMKEFLLAGSDEKVVTLSEGEGEEKKEVEVDLKGIFSKIIDSIPEDFKVSMSENTEHGEADKGEYTAEKIQKLADEASMTYSEMLVKLSAEKKI